MKSIIAILRHADYNQPSGVPSALLPYPLTDMGVAQAEAAAESLAAFSRDNHVPILPDLHSSHMLRAWQTARVIGDCLEQVFACEFNVLEFDVLAERNVGAMANLTVTQIEDIMAADPRYAAPPTNWKSSSDFCLPFQGAESLVTAGQRVAGHCRDAIATLDQRDNPCIRVIVGHGASIRHAAMDLGLLKADEVSSVSMYHASPMYLTCENGVWQLLSGKWKPRTKSTDGDEIRGG